ncbi:MAG: hypothetical protein A3B66_00680 [Alphaproteobacteria bacterium RIFCSPHIGHO2_02_FULL_46_13]|nr:MAG: hypothetical protein A3B66_00680 [Alphaproteobacteria bacterium RIFCSPHIGHO2_02_FULL_46_13]
MIEQSYAINRRNFIDAATRAGARVEHIPYKRSVLSDVELVTDIALLGPDDATQVVIVASGLHGVELPAGSLLQQIWLSELQKSLPQIQNTKFVFVHALNPHGAAFGMRTDWDINGQGNIDPARNFIDFSKATNTANFDIAAALHGADLSCVSAIKMWAKLLYSAFVEQGQKAFKQGFVRGQYTDPDIPYFGGRASSLSRLTWDEVISKYVRGQGNKSHVQKIWHLDCHTGDGPFGLLQLYINDLQGNHVYTDACRLMDADRIQMTQQYFANIAGDIVDYWPQCNIGAAEVTPMTLEFGTSSAKIEGIDVLNAILTRTILQNKYGDNHPKASTIIQRMRDAFSPRSSEWEKAVRLQSEMIWDRFRQILTVGE